MGAENRALGSGREMTLTSKKEKMLNKQAWSGRSDLIVRPSRIKRKQVIRESREARIEKDAEMSSKNGA